MTGRKLSSICVSLLVWRPADTGERRGSPTSRPARAVKEACGRDGANQPPQGPGRHMSDSHRAHLVRRIHYQTANNNGGNTVAAFTDGSGQLTPDSAPICQDGVSQRGGGGGEGGGEPTAPSDHSARPSAGRQWLWEPTSLSTRRTGRLLTSAHRSWPEYLWACQS